MKLVSLCMRCWGGDFLGPCTFVPVQAKRLHEEEHQQRWLGRFLQLVQSISLEDLLG